MKIIAHGKGSISDAVKTAEVALVLGVKNVAIECVPPAKIAVVSPGTLAFCPVAECCECTASPCPFGHQHGSELAVLQAEYAALEARLQVVGDRMREVIIHG